MTKTEILKTVRSLLSKYSENTILSPEDALYMQGVLQGHPESKHKIGCGIKDIFVKKTPYGNKAFHIRRFDGSITDFSFKKCIAPSNKRQAFLKALRAAIEDDIIEFKNNSFLKEKLFCKYTGQELTLKNSHVDHEFPMTFSKIAENFIEKFAIDFNSIDIKGGDMSYQPILPDDIRILWKKYHHDFARLRIISSDFNMKLGNRGEL